MKKNEHESLKSIYYFKMQLNKYLISSEFWLLLPLRPLILYRH